ncbi:hypothetical protein Bhyg_09471 [Pseudolycoriella hygida]|uniref:Metallothionein n=1 Tax=Pseudolycoriella hygida TaxID=35572 RepID=A0A9Q0S3Z6_9DIPT|nr:hypothetical protein Bhyg_09471 [Pseudolycoriella hygida]
MKATLFLILLATLVAIAVLPTGCTSSEAFSCGFKCGLQGCKSSKCNSATDCSCSGCP